MPYKFVCETCDFETDFTTNAVKHVRQKKDEGLKHLVFIEVI
jgi:hypothetical protein